MRRWWWCAALWPLMSIPVSAQETGVRQGIDGLRLALESAGLLLSHGELAGAKVGVIPEVRVFNAQTDPIHWDIRLPEVAFTPGDAAWSFHLPASFSASVRWGVGAKPWVFDITTQGAVFGLVKGADGAFDGASLNAQTIAVTSAPVSPGVFVATMNGLEFRNTEVGEAGFDERWAWDDGALRASFEVPGEGVLQIDAETVDVSRTRKGEQYGWLESLPWMAAIDRGMRVEEAWSAGRAKLEAATTLPSGLVDSDGLSLVDGSASWTHARTGLVGQAQASEAAWNTARAGMGWAVETPAATLAWRLPTHPSKTPQDWSVSVDADGTAFYGAVPLPFALDIDAQGSALLTRPLFGRVGDAWGWFPVLAALDGVEANLAPSSLAIEGQELRGQGRVDVMPSGVDVGLTLDGSGASWASSVAVWGGWPLLAEFLANPSVTEALAGPDARKVGWSGQGLTVEPVAP